MASSVRIFESEQAARDASVRLAEEGFRKQRLFTASDLAGREEAAIHSAVKQGFLTSAYATACIQHLKQGRSFIVVDAPFGLGEDAQLIMAKAKPGKSFVLPPPPMDFPAPLSDAIGWPTLTKFVPFSELAPSNWTLSGDLGLPLLSKSLTFGGGAIMASPTKAGPPQPDRPSPLSSAIGLPTLTKSKQTSA